jgi:hypothetical protein
VDHPKLPASEELVPDTIPVPQRAVQHPMSVVAPPGPLMFTTEVPPRTVDRPYFVSDGRVGAGEIRRFARACHDRQKELQWPLSAMAGIRPVVRQFVIFDP